MPLSPSRIATSKWNFWLYILGVHLNFYQNNTEICILFLNKVLGMAIHFIFCINHVQKIVNWNESWNNHLLINYEWSGYDNLQFTIMLVFGKFSLTTKQDGIVNCCTGYFSSKISSQQRSSCKKIKYVTICTHKKNLSNAHFYRNFVPFGRSDSGGWLNSLNSPVAPFVDFR